MKKELINRIALLGAILSLATSSFATVRTVTNTAVVKENPPEGSIVYEIRQLQDGDTLTFAVNAISLCYYEDRSEFFYEPIRKSVTMLGNGVTIGFSTPNDIDFGLYVTFYFDGSYTRIENVNFEVPLSITANSSEVVNCTFKPCYLPDANSLSFDYRTSASVHSVEGCAFLAEGDRMAQVYIGSASASATNTVNFTSCTFVNNATTRRTIIKQASTSQQARKFVSFTNCVLLDPTATDASPSVELYNIQSVGYNVFQGVMKPRPGGPAWQTQPSDIVLAADATEQPLTFDEGIYKVTAGDVAYRHLPANPKATVDALANASFPKYDLSGNVIDYLKPSHNGAWQTVYGDEDDGGTVTVTGIVVNFPAGMTLFTDTVYRFTAAVLSENGDAAQEVTWECADPHVTLTPSGTGNLDVDFFAEGITGDIAITVRVTAKDNGADGQPFVREFAVTLKPYVHVAAIALTDLSLTFGYSGGVRAVVLPADANWKELEWTVTDPGIASVTVEQGTDSITIKGLTEGVTTIMAQAKDSKLMANGTVTVTVSRPDYSDGVFIVNEDWWGHRPGSANFLYNDGRIDYEVFMHANHTPQYRLGSPAQFGAIYGGKFYIMSKAGIQMSVSNARTMDLYRGFANLGGGEGRFFFGVDEHTGYVGTSNGVRVVDLDELPDVPGGAITGGVAYPKVAYNLPGVSISALQTGGSALTGQVTTMKRVGERVFILQQGPLHVVTAATHQVEVTLTDHNYISMTQSKDGYLWLGTSGTAPDGTLDGDEESLTNYFVRLDPWTLERTVVNLPQGISGTASTYGAWQADAFQGSAHDNVLYWKSDNQRILRYDIATNRVDTVLDLSGMPRLPGIDAPWTLYGTSFAVSHETGELVVTTGTFIISCCVSDRDNWKILRVNPNSNKPRADANGVIGNITAEYPLEKNYWFPAMPVFPDKQRPEFTAALPNITLSGAHPVDSLGLLDKVADADNMRASIVTTVIDDYDKSLINAFIWRDTLVVASRKAIPAGQPSESTQLTLKFNSNGHVITHTFTVSLTAGVTGGIEENPFELTQQTLALYPGQTAQLALTAPQHFTVAWSSTNPAVASVTSTGLVTTLVAGTTLVIARDIAKGKADTCAVTVAALPSQPSYTLELNTSELHLAQGERATLQVAVTPQQAGQTPQWSTSDAAVADVTSGGTVIAIAPGTAVIRATLGTVSAVCAVTVSAQATQLVVGNIRQDAAQITFPKVTYATYYLAHIFELKSGVFKPFLTLKVTPDGLVSLRATAGNSLVVPLSYLSSGTSYVVQLEAVRETSGKAEVLQTEVAAFTTSGATGILAPAAGLPSVSYADGVLYMENLEGSECILTSLTGQTAGRFSVATAAERRRITLPAGMYILTAANESGRTALKFIAR